MALGCHLWQDPTSPLVATVLGSQSRKPPGRPTPQLRRWLAHSGQRSLRRRGGQQTPRRSPIAWLAFHPGGRTTKLSQSVAMGCVGVPSRLQAVIYDQQLEIHLVGYDTEDEIVSAVRSLRLASPA